MCSGRADRSATRSCSSSAATCTTRFRKPNPPRPTPPSSTGVDYLGMVVAAHEEQLLGHGGPTMSRAPWLTHFGFTRTPFSKTIPAAQLCDRGSHQEAVARIRFCISESLVGVITGEVGVGKTVAVRAAANQLDPSAH